MSEQKKCRRCDVTPVLVVDKEVDENPIYHYECNYCLRKSAYRYCEKETSKDWNNLNKKEDEELQKELEELHKHLLENSKPLESEIVELVNKNFGELLDR